MSVDQYDEIGVAYEGFKSLPMIRYSELPSFLGMLDDVIGRSVLDLACGTGFYTRRIKALGAADVLGVDISPAMIDAARAIERERPAGVRYAVADVAAMTLPDAPFDLVTAAYLLNYAESGTAMKRMCEGVRGALAPGGEFLTLTQNPDYRFDGPSTRKYGFLHEFEEQAEAGPRASITALLDPPVTITAHFPRRDVYESALTAAGFTDISWEPVHIAPEGIAAFGDAYWDDWRANPTLELLRCRAA
ncbi:class I SAM-dependent methyltransferase [Streptomyces sp. Ru73]|uniref:class I SAM-dependent methyltransferase n=1 Tax=Streptomyces sp. Ru73 TaxID=2080748 RepID=UPI000CDD65F7|nr:class I SAM-dependent methyltransferase [Streptomyces sp. Ru73]POX42513.1 class I SAM-dependent methyltransferase [Streptomyces sp. Ru73]